MSKSKNNSRGNVNFGFDGDFNIDDVNGGDEENLMNFMDDEDGLLGFGDSSQDTSYEEPLSYNDEEELSQEEAYEDSLDSDYDADYGLELDGMPMRTEDSVSDSMGVEVDEDETDGSVRVAYMVTDRNNSALLEYYRSLGIKINNVFYTFKDLRAALLMQTEPCRIILVETGAGKFTSLKNRKVMTDILGLCDGTIKASVFYTDSVVRSDSKYELGKNKHIKWFKYVSTAGVALHILKTGEQYVYDDPEDIPEPESEEAIYRMMGMQMPYGKMEDIGPNIITKGLLDLNMMQSSENLLEEYIPKI